jgi:hypothetical protein
MRRWEFIAATTVAAAALVCVAIARSAGGAPRVWPHPGRRVVALDQIAWLRRFQGGQASPCSVL